MPAKARFVRNNHGHPALKDGDWITIMGALLHDRQQDGRRLSRVLLTKSKPGRHVRLLRLIQKRRLTLDEMRREMKVSRRTIFRYLNSLEQYGLVYELGGDSTYRVVTLPTCLKRLL